MRANPDSPCTCRKGGREWGQVQELAVACAYRGSGACACLNLVECRACARAGVRVSSIFFGAWHKYLGPSDQGKGQVGVLGARIYMGRVLMAIRHCN